MADKDNVPDFGPLISELKEVNKSSEESKELNLQILEEQRKTTYQLMSSEDQFSTDQSEAEVANFEFDKKRTEESNRQLAALESANQKSPTYFQKLTKFFKKDALKEIMQITSAEIGDSIFLACGKINDVEKISALARDKIANDLNLIDNSKFAFCWIVDYPMFEVDDLTKKTQFSHNPFSLPQGDIEKINFNKPLEIKAYQYDIVCNGIELSSGAIRNHSPELMYKLFLIAGYDKKQVDEKFSGMINALSYGAPPHGGIAPGIDRIVMLLANEKNIREVTLFPLNQNAQDLLMGAPSEVDEKQLKELSLKIDKKINS